MVLKKYGFPRDEGHVGALRGILRLGKLTYKGCIPWGYIILVLFGDKWVSKDHVPKIFYPMLGNVFLTQCFHLVSY